MPLSARPVVDVRFGTGGDGGGGGDRSVRTLTRPPMAARWASHRRPASRA